MYVASSTCIICPDMDNWRCSIEPMLIKIFLSCVRIMWLVRRLFRGISLTLMFGTTEIVNHHSFWQIKMRLRIFYGKTSRWQQFALKWSWNIQLQISYSKLIARKDDCNILKRLLSHNWSPKDDKHERAEDIIGDNFPSVY